MSYVDEEPRRYPRVVDLRVIDWEINLLTQHYAQVHGEYVRILENAAKQASDVRQRYGALLGPGLASAVADFHFSNDGKDKVTMLKKIQDGISTLLSQAESTLADVYPQAEMNQEIVNAKRGELVSLAAKLQADKREIDGVLDELANLEGENQSTSLQHTSALYHYIAFGIAFLIMAFLTLRAYTTSESGAIETVILVLAGLMLAYYLIRRFLM
jgi:hypothetical protein